MFSQSVLVFTRVGNEDVQYLTIHIPFVSKGLTMRFNMPAGTNMPHVNYNTQTPYIPFNLGALSAMSNQQLEVGSEYK